jgi:hypothetical protein
MTSYLFRQHRYLDFVFSKDDACSFNAKLKALTAHPSSMQQLEIARWDEDNDGARAALELHLGSDDSISIHKNAISMTFELETCEYAASKLDQFIETGFIFPAELQSFDTRDQNKNVTVYFYDSRSYNPT